MHFTRLSADEHHEIPTIVRGEGVWVYDQHGKRYLDGLSGLFTSQIGHGRTELAEAAAAPGFSSWPTSRYGATPTPPPSSWPTGWPT